MPELEKPSEDQVRELLKTAHERIQAHDDSGAVEALNKAGEVALRVLVARVESGEPPSDITQTDHAAWHLVSQSSTQYQHGNNQLGEWYREGARRRALQRYELTIG
ncbi:MAG TPA: hypothetical protein VHU62_11750 [Mycobacterium sp.]|jgi:hypothetical protein|nr:hypothetical protein [Mycobacterium sp.]